MPFLIRNRLHLNESKTETVHLEATDIHGFPVWYSTLANIQSTSAWAYMLISKLFEQIFRPSKSCEIDLGTLASDNQPWIMFQHCGDLNCCFIFSWFQLKVYSVFFSCLSAKTSPVTIIKSLSPSFGEGRQVMEKTINFRQKIHFLVKVESAGNVTH